MSFLKRNPNKIGRYLPYFSAMALAGAGMFISAPAQAAECSALIGDVKAGKLYAVTILKGKGQVKIETLNGDCFESLEKWKARGLPMASLGNGSFIAPPKKKKIYTPPPIPMRRLTAPPPTSDYSGRGRVLPPPADVAGPTGAPGDQAIPKPPVREGRCDRVITDFWSPGEIDVKGSPYRLSGAFTVDLDGDGWVDNVGFKLKITGRVGNVIRYFDTPGRLSGQTIPDLKIANDDDISRICPGNVTFKSAKPEEPAEEQEKVAKNEIEIPEKPAEKEPEKKKKGLSGISLAVFSGAGVLLFVSGIVILFMLQPEFAARRRKKKEEEKGEGEEEGEKK